MELRYQRLLGRRPLKENGMDKRPLYSTDSWVKAGLKYVKPSVMVSRVPGSCFPDGPLIIIRCSYSWKFSRAHQCNRSGMPGWGKSRVSRTNTMSITTLNNNRRLAEVRDGDLVGDAARLTARSGIHGGTSNAPVELRIEIR